VEFDIEAFRSSPSGANVLSQIPSQICPTNDVGSSSMISSRSQLSKIGLDIDSRRSLMGSYKDGSEIYSVTSRTSARPNAFLVVHSDDSMEIQTR
jgi:hypothetical protein